MSNSEQPTTYLTDEVKSYIGMMAEPVTAWEVIEGGAVRRFTQAIMDNDPHYWDPQVAANSRYGALIAPPLYPSFTLRRTPGSPDPLEAIINNPDADGTGGMGGGSGLPTIPLPLVRLLNGGVEAEFFAYAKQGDLITAQSRYADIYEKPGRSGLMVFTVMETTYTNQDGQLLLKTRNTTIRR